MNNINCNATHVANWKSSLEIDPSGFVFMVYFEVDWVLSPYRMYISPPTGQFLIWINVCHALAITLCFCFAGHGVTHSKHRPDHPSNIRFPPRQIPASYRSQENASNTTTTMVDHSLGQMFISTEFMKGDEEMGDQHQLAGKQSQLVEMENQLTADDFVKMKMQSEVPFMDESRIHVSESLQGKQKYCLVCKHLGRRTNDGTLAVRTRAKCCVCDIPLCKGPPRNCFRDFHEICRLCKYPNLQWTLL